MNGKGDNQRPRLVDRDTYESNWERVFGKKLPQEQVDSIVEAVESASKEVDDGR